MCLSLQQTATSEPVAPTVPTETAKVSDSFSTTASEPSFLSQPKIPALPQMITVDSPQSISQSEMERYISQEISRAHYPLSLSQACTEVDDPTLQSLANVVDRSAERYAPNCGVTVNFSEVRRGADEISIRRFGGAINWTP